MTVLERIGSLRICATFVLLSSALFAADAAAQRTTVLISDTHLGVGRDADGRWLPNEDFRWPQALGGFLDHVGTKYKSAVDLVVLGDFIELWQPYENMPCAHPEADLGCTPAELAELARRIVGQHREELAAIAKFAAAGDHRVYLVPGNHDSALMTEEVWSVVRDALATDAARIVRVDSGIWYSADHSVAAEHGHQIGRDVNRYAQWPKVTQEKHGVVYLVRPWGEQFVQSLFNATEKDYPIIDNIAPESAGARYRAADRGAVASALDVARFAAFNLFETSWSQKGQALGPDDATPDKRDYAYAKKLGHRLFVAAYAAGDPLRLRIETNDEDGQAIRAELDELAGGLANDELAQLCDHAAIRSKDMGSHFKDICVPPEQGAVLGGWFNTKEAVLKAHVTGLRMQAASVRYFVYGHTHQLETPWDLDIGGGVMVKVANTGAFHRVVDANDFERLRKKRGLSPDQALRRFDQADLPPCYTFVVVAPSGPDRLSIARWAQAETSDTGSAVEVGDGICR